MKFQLHKKRNFQHLDLWISRHYQLISPNEFHSPTPTLVGEGFLSNLSFRSEQTVRKRYSWSDNKKTGSVACPPSHLSSSSVAAPSGQLLAAILSKIMFLVKQPSVVYRVLNSDLCPPHACLLNSRKLLFLVAIMHKFPSWIVFSVFTSLSDYVCCLWWFGAVCTSGWYCHDFCAFHILNPLRILIAASSSVFRVLLLSLLHHVVLRAWMRIQFGSVISMIIIKSTFLHCRDLSWLLLRVSLQIGSQPHGIKITVLKWS